MSYLALYRKYRPSNFSEVAGQKYVVEILKNAIKTQNISHAYLFSGPRGTGKTSIAKIFSKAVNCLDPIDGESCKKCKNCKYLDENDVDIIEIDAASNNGVDEIREIRNNVKLLPTVGKYKIYIIDEVHMLSIGAFNALLKTLEEPPQHVIFILATTEIQKIPLTIISRCQKFDFKKISEVDIENKLKEIVEKEKKKIPNDVLLLISKLSDGGLRDAINLLDQVINMSSKSITVDDIYNLNGDISDNELEQMFDLIISANISDLLKKVDDYYTNGKNIYFIIEKLTLLTKNININNNVKNYFNEYETKKLEKYSNLSNEKLNYISGKLISLLTEIKKSENQKLLLEISLLEIIENFSQENIKESEKVVKFLPKEDKENVNLKLNEDENIISREIISIRINNTFCNAKKELLEENKRKLLKIDEYISNEKYNKIVNILKNSELVVSSNTNLLFKYRDSSEVNLFLFNIEKIEKFLKEILGEKYKIVAITSEEWNNLKKEYIKNKKNGIKYTLKEEPKITKQKIKNNNLIVSEIFGEENIDIK